MTPAQIDAVRTSWAQVTPIAAQAARLFYERLFELDPGLRALFGADRAAQERKLLAALDATVRGLERLETLRPMLAALGARHAGYGVRATHYATVGAALLWTLERGLQQRYTTDVDAAWRSAYALIAGVMQAGATQSAGNKVDSRHLA